MTTKYTKEQERFLLDCAIADMNSDACFGESSPFHKAKEMLKAAQEEGLLLDEVKLCDVGICKGELKEECSDGDLFLVCQECNSHKFTNKNNNDN